MASLQPVDYDPFAAKPKAPKFVPVDHDPFAVKHPEDAVLAIDPKARITSTERSAAHNRAVGGVPNSHHLTGDAVDFQPGPGRTRAEDVAALQARDPKRRELLDEGNHVHYTPSHTPTLSPVDGDPFAPVAAKPAAPQGLTAAQWNAMTPQEHLRHAAQTQGARARAAPVGPAQGPPEHPMGPGFAEATARRAHGPLQNLRQDLGLAPQDPYHRASTGTLAQVGNTGLDLLGLGTSWIGGAAEGTLNAVDTLRKPDGLRELRRDSNARMGDVAEALTPIPIVEGANAVRGAVRGVKAARTAHEAEALAQARGLRLTPVEHDPFVTPRVPPRDATAVSRPAMAATGPRLTPVDHNPFETKPLGREGPRLTPVDGDPFAQSGRSLAASERGPAAPELHDTTASGVIGHEEHPIERLDNAMYRLGRHDVAGKIEAMQDLKKVPKEIKNPDVQEELTHALERRLVDPEAPLPPHLAEAEAVRQPWAERQRTAVNAIQERADRGELGEPYEADTGYVPRNVVGKGSKFDLGLPGDRQGVPGRSLSTNTASTKARDFYVVTDKDGNRFFQQGKPHETDIKDRPYASTRQATIAEIEANSDTRYHKNALVNTIDRALHDEAVVRNLDVLAEIKKNLKADGLAHQFEWHYRNEDGQWVQQRNRAPRPPGFVEVPHIPQLRGWAFDQRVADVLKDYHPPADEPVANIIQKTNRLLQASMFITPFPHIANVSAMWTVGRGWDWLNPAGYARMMRTGSKAMSEVMTMGPTYRRMLREGSALMSADDATRNFYQTMLESAGHSIENDPRTFRAVADAFMTGNMTPKDVAGLLYNTSHKVLWSVNDMMLLQRQLELEAKGLSTAKAIKEAERWIANYRVPSQVMGQRWMKQLLTDNQFLSFGRYDYGKWRSIGEMVKPFIGKASAAERVDATGKALVLATMLTAGYPVMDYMAQKVTGNKGARVHRGGQAAIVDAAERLTTGQIGWAQAMGSMVSPSPVIEAGPEILSNRDLFTGKELINPESSAPSKAVQAARAAARYFTPGQIALDAMDDKNPMKGIAALGGISLPNRDPEDARNIGRKIDQRDAKSRLKRDPLERAVNP